VDARNYAVLAEIKTLELLVLPSELSRAPGRRLRGYRLTARHPKLRQLESETIEHGGGWEVDYAATGSKDVFWQDWDREQTFVPAMRRAGSISASKSSPWALISLYFKDQPLRDLSFLKGAPISVLIVIGGQVTDLTPLRDLPLDELTLWVIRLPISARCRVNKSNTCGS
jgi:hypothetical protein